MNKKELVEQVAVKTGNTKKDTEAVVSAVFDTIRETLAKKENVQLAGFGTFSVKLRKARTGIKPGTKETVEYPAKHVLKMTPAKAVKEAINS